MSDIPPLPPPDTHCFDDDTGRDVWSYSAAQMRAYALAARRAALEEAAKLCESTYPELHDGAMVEFLCFSDPADCAAAIRALAVPPVAP